MNATQETKGRGAQTVDATGKQQAARSERRRATGKQRFAELAVTTNFSFLTGGSHPEELAFAAAELGLAGIAVADRNTLAGVVRGHLAAKEAGLRYAVGCRLSFRDGTPDILAWPPTAPPTAASAGC